MAGAGKTGQKWAEIWGHLAPSQVSFFVPLALCIAAGEKRSPD